MPSKSKKSTPKNTELRNKLKIARNKYKNRCENNNLEHGGRVISGSSNQQEIGAYILSRLVDEHGWIGATRLMGDNNYFNVQTVRAILPASVMGRH
tara:strand:+ start:1133 stop:1420 length:288 start_codon:yes stop_codon:yes gene_type:complete